MAIPMFWRLMLGHAAILSLSVAACIYSVVQLGTLGRSARSAVDTDHRMINYQEALTEAFLSQARYGGKYLITHKEDRHAQSRQFKSDFFQYFGALKSLAQTEPILESLSRIESLHARYHELFEREVGYVRAAQPYAQSRYQQERDKVLESALTELDRMKAQLRTDLHDKLDGIDRAAGTARKIAIITTLGALLLGILISLKLSNSLTAAPKQPKRSAPAVNPEGTGARIDTSAVLAKEAPSFFPKDFLALPRLKLKRLIAYAVDALKSLTRRLASMPLTMRKGH
jgi:CHASE3 domain sensor protein